jgi:hypothetical protein
MKSGKAGTIVARHLGRKIDAYTPAKRRAIACEHRV